jgi:hypothetical protein
VRLGQGREKARQFLMDNKDLAAVLEATIREKLVPAPEKAPVPAPPAAAMAPDAPRPKAVEPSAVK